MTVVIHVIIIAPMTPKIENNKFEFIDPLLDGVVDCSMMLKVSETKVMIVIADTDVVTNLLLPLVVIASDKLLVTETIKICNRSNVHIITHNIAL